MTRVAIDYTAAIQQGAGIGRYTRSLVDALAEHPSDGSYVLFYAQRSSDRSSDPRARSWPDRVRLRPIPMSDRHLALLWQRLRIPLPVEWLTGDIDIYHSPDFCLAPVRRARTVLTVHDLSFMRHPECSPPQLLSYLMDAVPRSVRRADVVLADSESTRNDITELMGLPAERVRVLYAGVEPRFQPQGHPELERSTLAKYGIQRPYILSVGTLQPRKNYPRLIQAFDQLRRAHDVPHQLVIVGGKGWLFDEIEETIDALGLGEHVLLAGFAADGDLPTLYRAADVFSFVSIYEGFGIPVLEAMACGTPVVTSAVSSLPEVSGEAALTVTPTDVEALADALWRLLSDQELRDSLRHQGFSQARGFSWGRSAERLTDIYAEIA